MAKIKVLRIINRFSIGGPSFHAIILTKHVGEEFETKLIGGVPDEGEADSFYVLDSYQVNAITIPEMRRSLNLFSDIKSYFKIKQFIKEYQPDIVHTHASKAGALGRIAAYTSGVKTIVHTYHGHVFHSYFGRLKTEIYKFVERFLAKKSTGIIAISESQKNELSDVYNICPKEKIQVIPLGLFLDPFSKNSLEKKQISRKNLGIQENEVVIGLVGRLAPIKDHGYFLQVIKRIMTISDKKIKVFIVGDGVEMDNVKAQVDEINEKYPELIHLTSWVKEMAPMYHAFDIVCLSSKNEGTPVTLIEAQAAGLPVISTDVGGVRDIIEDQQTGFVVPKSDINQYVQKLTMLIESKELREQFGEQGKTKILEKYQYQRLVKDMEGYYRSLMEKR